MTRKLSTTSYAVLGLLAIRPWSAYELTKQARRSLTYAWSKTESVLYDEPKRLVSMGLVRATEEANGQRTRTMYAITDEGAAALRDWLATSPEPPRFELEMLLRLMFADHGSKADLLGSIAATREWVRERRAVGGDQIEGYVADGGPFPDRLHIIVLFATLVSRLLDAIDDWADEAEAEVRTWRRTRNLGLTPGTGDLLDELHRHVQERAPAT